MNIKKLQTAWAFIKTNDRTIMAIIKKVVPTSKTTADVILKDVYDLNQYIGNKRCFKSTDINFFYNAKELTFEQLLQETK